MFDKLRAFQRQKFSTRCSHLPGRAGESSGPCLTELLGLVDEDDSGALSIHEELLGGDCVPHWTLSSVLIPGGTTSEVTTAAVSAILWLNAAPPEDFWSTDPASLTGSFW